ncbi:zinc metalloprotease [Streptomyces sp. NPDC089919]|uniref:zinc metalloprotease n=1 Tax=Streptomyces sp. NPDC089919 TaxID=3155188 RepID=UPI00341B48EA
MSEIRGGRVARAAVAFVVATAASAITPTAVAATYGAGCVVPERPATASSANLVPPATAARVEASRRAGAAAPVTARRAGTPIPVYVHVVSKDSTPEGGNLSDQQVFAQVAVLNQAYSPTNVQFRLASITRMTNSGVFNDATPWSNREAIMKELRRGGADALNIYTVGAPDGHDRNLLGHATFPWDYKAAPKRDGIVVHYGTLPGGNVKDRNLGKTAVRMTGHWLGLFNTFQGGCSNPGDYVDDTAPEAIGSNGCPEGRDSCPGGELDPIHNYMDTGIDTCATEFTPGQAARIKTALSAYRNINL